MDGLTDDDEMRCFFFYPWLHASFQYVTGRPTAPRPRAAAFRLGKKPNEVFFFLRTPARFDLTNRREATQYTLHPGLQSATPAR